MHRLEGTAGSRGSPDEPAQASGGAFLTNARRIAICVLLVLVLAYALPRALAVALLIESELRATSIQAPRWIVILGGGSGNRVRAAEEFSRRWPQARIALAGSKPELTYMNSVASELYMCPCQEFLVEPPSTRASARVLADLERPVVIFTHRWHARRVRYLWIRETYQLAPDLIDVDDGPAADLEVLKLVWTILFY